MRKALLPVLVAVCSLLISCQSGSIPAAPAPIDETELAKFADDFFPRRMEALGITGLSFILVQDGSVLLARGYGYADIESGVPIDPQSTVMRIGSVSKPFVAVAVMQLVESGQLSLDVNVNHYLNSLQVKSDHSAPVTLARILTHTAGFEDPPYVSNTDPASVRPLAQFLAESMPPSTHPPGSEHIYSNYGYALAALVVEETTGESFDRYVLNHILLPLQMNDTAYLLAPPPPAHMATGYTISGGVQEPQPLDYDSDYPGGSIVSTASNMSKFLLALLGEGCHEEACILQPASLAEMMEPRANTPYEGQRVTYGFVEGTIGNHVLLGHSGAIRGFGSFLALLPDLSIGYFISFNEECYETSACDIIPEFRRAFADQFLG
jgi:CubicO group peptidase (beta-lactamase class C family)